MMKFIEPKSSSGTYVTHVDVMYSSCTK